MRTVAIVVLAVALLACSAVEAKARWNYRQSSRRGPDRWGEITGFESCDGQRQSPTNINQVVKDDSLPRLGFEYKPSTLNIKRGKVVSINMDEGSTLSLGSSKYALEKIDWHVPSEHQIRGISFPMEAQLVHRHVGKKNDVVIVSVLFAEADSRPSLAAFTKHAGRRNFTVPDVTFNAQSILPRGGHGNYFTYSGSETAPPCKEGVTWFVLRDYSSASESQVERVRQVVGGEDNNRPVQNWHARRPRASTHAAVNVTSEHFPLAPKHKAGANATKALSGSGSGSSSGSGSAQGSGSGSGASSSSASGSGSGSGSPAKAKKKKAFVQKYDGEHATGKVVYTARAAWKKMHAQKYGSQGSSGSGAGSGSGSA